MAIDVAVGAYHGVHKKQNPFSSAVSGITHWYAPFFYWTVDLTTYHITISDLPKVAAVKAEFVKENFPPWTAVGVTELALPGMLIEVKVTAVIGSSR